MTDLKINNKTLLTCLLFSVLKRNPGMSFVCIDKEKNKIVGTILCGHDGRRGYICHLSVLDRHHERAIAKTLLKHRFAKLKSVGIEHCIIMVKDISESGK